MKLDMALKVLSRVILRKQWQVKSPSWNYIKIKGEKIPMPATARAMLDIIAHKEFTPQQKIQQLLSLLNAALKKTAKGRDESTTAFYQAWLKRLETFRK